jgi:hypothetical protein
MPWVGFKPKTSVLERAKAVHGLDRAATGTGLYSVTPTANALNDFRNNNYGYTGLPHYAYTLYNSGRKDVYTLFTSELIASRSYSLPSGERALLLCIAGTLPVMAETTRPSHVTLRSVLGRKYTQIAASLNEASRSVALSKIGARKISHFNKILHTPSKHSGCYVYHMI